MLLEMRDGQQLQGLQFESWFDEASNECLEGLLIKLRHFLKKLNLTATDLSSNRSRFPSSTLRTRTTTDMSELLQGAVSRCAELAELTLRNANFTQSALTRVLQCCRCLEKLSLVNCAIEHLNLADGLQHCRHLKEVYIVNSGLTERDAEALSSNLKPLRIRTKSFSLRRSCSHSVIHCNNHSSVHQH